METEGTIRLALYAAAAVALALAEAAWPRKVYPPGRLRRWVGNLGLAALSALCIRLLFPVLPVALAVLLRERGFGLIPWLGLPEAVQVVLGFLLLDLAIYLQHRAFHALPLLWRLHRVHHADTCIDFTTGVRFHPVEYILSMAFKLALVAVLGPSALAVLAFEVVLNAVAMFNHANIRLPLAVDGALRLLVVTPDMHRVHHSTIGRELNHNFGFNSPWWDRLLGTYQAQPVMGHEAMAIGLGMFRDVKYRSLPRLLAMPFYRPAP